MAEQGAFNLVTTDRYRPDPPNIMHHTKDKGDLGVLMAQAALAAKGFMILHPLTEHAPFDLVTYKDGKFRRVQVRYSAASKGVIAVKLTQSWADKSGNHFSSLDKDSVDDICVFCPDTQKCYLLEVEEISALHKMYLRLNATGNNVKKNVNWAKDYEL